MIKQLAAIGIVAVGEKNGLPVFDGTYVGKDSDGNLVAYIDKPMRAFDEPEEDLDFPESLLAKIQDVVDGTAKVLTPTEQLAVETVGTSTEDRLAAKMPYMIAMLEAWCDYQFSAKPKYLESAINQIVADGKEALFK